MPGMVPPSARPKNARATKSPVWVFTNAVHREIKPKVNTRKGIQNRGPTAFRMMFDGISTLSFMLASLLCMVCWRKLTQCM